MFYQPLPTKKTVSTGEKISGVAVGIDLGTTNSCVAVYKDGVVEIIPNEHGNRITPSCVAFTETDRLIGEAAKDQDYRNPTNTVFDAKRLIGRLIDDPTLQSDIKNWPFQVTNEGDKPKIQVQFRGQEKSFYPEEISAMILEKMKEIAKRHLGETVSNAVITVPAYFNNSQRQSTKDAGAIAGLNVLRIINEPTAAALGYGFGRDVIEKNVLIYDFGGGTFDVSILSIEKGVFEVKATTGSTHLGGEDIDDRLVNYFADEFERNHDIDLRGNKKALRRLRSACEKAKINLSHVEQATIDLICLIDDINFNSTISRAFFEDLNKDLFSGTLEMVDKALNYANMRKSDIHDIVLVGGSTRIPKVQKLLNDFFNGKPLKRSVNPDEVVATGSAIQAAILAGNQVGMVQDILLVDVTPLSLGTKLYNGLMSVVVKRNTPIPAKQTKGRKTVTDDQTKITFKIYEGEHNMAENNNLLGKFTLHGIQQAPRGETKADVTFEINENGILEVTAVERTTTNTSKITIVNESHHSKESVYRMIRDAENYRREDIEREERIEARNKLEDYCFKRIDKLYEIKGAVLIIDKFNETINWLGTCLNAEVDEYVEKLEELKTACEPINAHLKIEDD